MVQMAGFPSLTWLNDTPLCILYVIHVTVSLYIDRNMGVHISLRNDDFFLLGTYPVVGSLITREFCFYVIEELLCSSYSGFSCTFRGAVQPLALSTGTAAVIAGVLSDRSVSMSHFCHIFVTSSWVDHLLFRAPHE